MADRPRFHMAPTKSWVNDPNGPLLHKGMYHIFYQYIVDATKWTWGLRWGHSTSPDLVHWKRLPVALEPTPGSFDQDGCFSGCATVDTDGVPAILYTGVVRKPDAPHLRPSSVAVSKLCTERQLLARAADPDDVDLVRWVKAQQPWLSSPPTAPPSGPVGCWRDPFIIQRPSSSNDGRWRVLLGSGAGDPIDAPAEALGTLLVYSSEQLDSGWEFEGDLCRAQAPEQGLVWECPVLCQLPPLSTQSAVGADLSHGAQHVQASASSTPATHGQEAVATPTSNNSSCSQQGRQQTEDQPVHLLSVSAGRSPALYWLGHYDSCASRFDIGGKETIGPLPLDYGDLLYAPNLLQDAKGRIVMWGWLSELPSNGVTHDYAGALTVPRVLQLHEGHLHQQPLPELMQLRTGRSWHAGEVTVTAGKPEPLAPGRATTFADIEMTLQPGNGAHAVEVLIAPANGAPSASNVQAAVLQYDFNSCTLTLTVGAACDIMPMRLEHSEPGHSPNHTNNSEGSGSRTMGGVLEGIGPHEPLALRLLLDYSVVEVFTGSGQALATRVYRGSRRSDLARSSSGGAAADHVGLWLLVDGGVVTARDVAVHDMASIWDQDIS